MTAVQRNQIKTDNKWSAEEACGHRAEVRELLTTTIAHSASVFFICSICRFPFLVCIALSHFFWFSFIISRHFFGSRSLYMSFLHPFIYFSLHFLFFSALSGTFFCVYWTVSLPPCCFCLLAAPVLRLFSCLTLYLCLYSVTSFLW